MIKRITASAVVALLTCLSLFAGGSREKSVKEITLWHSNSGKNGECFEEIIDAFNEGEGKEKGIFIDAVYQGKANDVLTKVKANAIAGDSLPDIAQLDATAALDMSNADYLKSVDELGFDTSDILAPALAAYMGKELLAVPFNASALLLYYNKTLFDSLGIKVPKTFDEMIEIASLLKEEKEGKTIRYAIAGVPTTYELTSFIGAQKGGSYMVDNRNGHDGRPERVLFKEEGTYKAFLEKWKALYQTGALSNITSGISTEFAAGRCAMMFASSSNLTSVISSVDSSFEVGVAEVPALEAEYAGDVAVGGGALFSFSDNAEVKAVLEYLTSEPVQLKWAEDTGYIPVNKRLYESNEYMEFIKENPLFETAAEEVRNSDEDIINVWLPSAYQIYYSFQESVKSAITGEKTIDQAVDSMEKTVKQALEDYGKQNSN